MVVHKQTFKKAKNVGKKIGKFVKKVNPFAKLRRAIGGDKKRARRPSRAKSVRKRRPRRNRA